MRDKGRYNHRDYNETPNFLNKNTDNQHSINDPHLEYASKEEHKMMGDIKNQQLNMQNEEFGKLKLINSSIQLKLRKESSRKLTRKSHLKRLNLKT